MTLFFGASRASFFIIAFALSTILSQAALAQDAPAATFTNSSPITIASSTDNTPMPANPYPSTINVSGLTGVIPNTAGSVKVTLNNVSHTWIADVAIVLIGPTGAAFLLQDGAGLPGSPGTSLSNVTYTLSDTGAANLPNNSGWAAGTYKPTGHFVNTQFPAPGPVSAYSHPGPAGGNSATFGSVFGGTNPNGEWKLFVGDYAPGDDGVINGGWTIEINPTTPPSTNSPVDMNGDGKTDFQVVRNTGGGTDGAATWYTWATGGNPVRQDVQFGIASDFFVPADYDGDGIDDIAVFRPGAQGVFYVLRSGSQSYTLQEFGQTGDNPTVIGDYNGDNIDDLAVYRAGATSGAQSTWYYTTLGVGGFTAVSFGVNGDFPIPGDYDGDGKTDVAVQRPEGADARVYILTATSFISEYFGLANDSVVPGDYDGDGKTDLAIVRDVGGTLTWVYDPSSIAGLQYVTTNWGVVATDIVTPGDYNGDGKTDFAIWRSEAQGTFWVLHSGVGTIVTQNWGVNGDFPTANYVEQ